MPVPVHHRARNESCAIDGKQEGAAARGYGLWLNWPRNGRDRISSESAYSQQTKSDYPKACNINIFQAHDLSPKRTSQAESVLSLLCPQLQVGRHYSFLQVHGNVKTAFLEDEIE